MKKPSFSKTTAKLIFSKKSLRTTLILIILLILILIGLVTANSSLENKIAQNRVQIQDSQKQLAELQKITNEDDESFDELTEGRVFAPYEQIVPFISLLESLFGIIDPNSKINLNNQEKQIIINRYADYEVILDPGNKVELLLKALEELHSSKYLNKITNFTINYTPSTTSPKNMIQTVNLTIRLYFE